MPRDAPVASRQYAAELTEQNRRAWEHYQECRAVGHFPDDPIVRRLGGLLRRMEDNAMWSAQREQASLAGALRSLVGVLVMGARRA